jgi:hypothetical protein
VELPRLRVDRRLRSSDRHSSDRGEVTDIAPVPIAKEAAGCQLVVTEPFSAKVFRTTDSRWRFLALGRAIGTNFKRSTKPESARSKPDGWPEMNNDCQTTSEP